VELFHGFIIFNIQRYFHPIKVMVKRKWIFFNAVFLSGGINSRMNSVISAPQSTISSCLIEIKPKIKSDSIQEDYE